MKEVVLKVEGMHCTGCENRIQNAVSLIEGVTKVQADHTNGEVKVTMDKEVLDQVKAKIQDLDFQVK